MNRSRPEFRYGINETCDNVITQAFYTGRHEIDVEIYNALQEEYFTSGDRTEQNFTADYIKTTEDDCDNFYLQFTYDASLKTNADIKFKVMHGPLPVSDPTNPLQTKAYSIQLFRGIKNLFAPEVFLFSKGGSGNDLIFKATIGLRVVYYGDLTSSFPFDPHKVIAF